MEARSNQESKGEEATEKPGDEKKVEKTEPNKLYDENMMGCACQRWLFIALAFPLLIVCSLLGLMLMAVLAPFWICCSKMSCFDQLWTGVWKNLVKLPANGIYWAIGRDPDHKGSSESINGQETKTYGGTDLEMGDGTR